MFHIVIICFCSVLIYLPLSGFIITIVIYSMNAGYGAVLQICVTHIHERGEGVTGSGARPSGAEVWVCAESSCLTQ